MPCVSLILDNRISCSFIDADNLENTIFCRPLEENLDNVCLIQTKNAEFIHSYIQESTGSYIISTVTLENGEVYESVRFRVVTVEEGDDLPVSTINTSALGAPSATTYNTPIQISEDDDSLIFESNEEDDFSLLYETSNLNDNHDIIEKVKSLEEKLKEEQKEARRKQVRLDEERLILDTDRRLQKTLDDYKSELLQETFLISEHQKEILEKTINSLGSSLQEQFDSQQINVGKYLDEISVANLDELKKYQDSQVSEIKKEITCLLSEHKDLSQDEINKQLLVHTDELEKLLAQKLTLELESHKRELSQEVESITTAVDKLVEEKLKIESQNIDKLLIDRSGNLQSKFSEDIDSKLNENKKSLFEEFKSVSTTTASTLFSTKTEELNNALESIINEHRQGFSDTVNQKLNEVTSTVSKFTADIDGKLPQLEDTIKNINKRIQNLVIEKKNVQLVVDDARKYTDTKVAQVSEDVMNYARRILDLGGGGGSVAVQYANGGTMNGDLNVTGQYLSGGVSLFALLSGAGGGTGRDDVNTVVISSSANWNTAYTVATTYQNASGSFATNTLLESTSALLTPLTLTDTLTSQLVLNTALKSLSGDWQSTYTTVQNNSATAWNYQGTDLKDLSGNWQSTYETVESLSANWNTGFNSGTVYSQNSASYATNDFVITNFFNLTGGIISGPTRINNNLTVFGNLTATGTTTFANTVFSVTSALSVVHFGSGPALWVGNNGDGDIASFYDIDQNVEVFHIGGNNGNFPNVGVKTSSPNVDFTVNGQISANNTIWSAGGNSNNWNNAFNIATSYQNASGSFATNTLLQSTSALLTPLTLTRTLTGQLVLNTTINSLTGNWNSAYASTTALNLSSNNWNSVYTSWNSASATSIVEFNDTRFSKLSSQAYTLNGNSILPVLGGNTASGSYSNIAGGRSNTAPGNCSNVAGGFSNTASGTYSNVAGGSQNTASGIRSNVAGGCINRSCGTFSNIAGGQSNRASGNSSNVAGGRSNTASGYISNIAGGFSNTASGTYSNVAGGSQNTASGNCSTIGGGYANFNPLRDSIIGGGVANHTGGFAPFNITTASISGNGTQTRFTGTGIQNNFSFPFTTNNVSVYYSTPTVPLSAGTFTTATIAATGTNFIVVNGDYSTCTPTGLSATSVYVYDRAINIGDYGNVIGGGKLNTASGDYNFVGAGFCNRVGVGSNNAIVGGSGNINIGISNSTIAGGNINCIGTIGNYAFIGGGRSNTVSNWYSFIGGGQFNSTAAQNVAIAGGASNSATSNGVAIAGGCSNTAAGFTSNINGGFCNIITSPGQYSAIGGGKFNYNPLFNSSIEGGSFNHTGGFTPVNITSSASISGNGTNTVLSATGIGSCFSASNTTGAVSIVFTTQATGPSLSAACFGLANVVTNPGGNCITINGNYSTCTANSVSATSIYVYDRCLNIGGCNNFIGGGVLNTASGCYNVIGGGICNTTNNACGSFIGGGIGNSIVTSFGGCQNSIVGGTGNLICSGTSQAVILGGTGNIISAQWSTASGYRNCVLNQGGIAMGASNRVCGNFSVSLGQANTSCGSRSTVSGAYNLVSGSESTVIGGCRNNLIGTHSFIGAGACNIISSNYSFVAGGSANNTRGFDNTFILGTALSASAANFTYVNNLSSQGVVVANPLRVGNSQSATGPVGSITGKVEIFNATGTSLGFIPVYGTIT